MILPNAHDESVRQQVLHEILSQFQDQDLTQTAIARVDQGASTREIGSFVWDWFIQRINSLQTELNKAQMTLNAYGIPALVKRNEELHNLLDEDKRKLLQAEIRIQKLETENGDLNNQLNQLETKFSSFRTNTNRMKNSFEKRISNLNSEITARDGIIAEQQLRLERLVETDD